MTRRWIGCLVLALLPAGCATRPPATPPPPAPAVGFVEFETFGDFDLGIDQSNGALHLTSSVIAAPLVWDELVVSWNIESGPGIVLRVEARAMRDGEEPGGFLRLADWTPDNLAEPRRSPPPSREPVVGDRADVDVLKLARPAQAVQVRFILEKTLPVPARLKYVGLSFRDSTAPLSVAEGTLEPLPPLPVPPKSQADYPEERGWCSPACVAMVLGFWAAELDRPELALDVPAAARAVFDRNYNGTGNWSFNTAHAGSFVGLRGRVARLRHLGDVRKWVAAGVPVVISGPYSLLTGNPRASSAGHLVVVVGFTEVGDVIVNDPWAVAARGQAVRRVYPRENVERAWARSGNTAYLIHPEKHPVPDLTAAR